MYMFAIVIDLWYVIISSHYQKRKELSSWMLITYPKVFGN